MKAIWYMTWRQLTRSRLRTALAFCSVFLSTVLLCATLVGGESLEACLHVRQDSTLGIMVRAASVFVAVVLLFATAILIRQSFTLSLAERVRALGQLASVGATRRQLMGSVYMEAALFGAAAIPAGILCALAGLGATFALLNAHTGIAQSLSAPLRLHVLPGTLIGCAAWTAVDLLLAAHKPARTAFGISPLQAVRQADPGTMRRPRRQITAPDHLPQRLAAISMQRQSKRWRAVSLGLAVYTVLLILTLGFSGMVRSAYAAETEAEFDAFLYRMYFWSEKGAYPAEALAAVEDAMAGQEHLTVELFESVSVRSGSENSDGADRFYCTRLLILRDEDFAAWYGSALEPRADALPCVLSAADSAPEAASPDDPFGPLCVAGSVLELAPQPPCATPLPLGAGRTNSGYWEDYRYKILVTSRSAFAAGVPSLGEDTDRSFAVYCAPDDGIAVTRLLAPVLQNAGILRYVDQDYTPTSWTVLRRLFVQVILQVFTAGFAALVFLVCAASVFGMVSANLMLRRREFALLRSIGLTDAGLYAMLRHECLRFGALGLAAGLPLGALGVWQVARLLALNVTSHVRAYFFLLPAGCVAVIVAGSVLLCRRTLAKQTVVEGLRQSE